MRDTLQAIGCAVAVLLGAGSLYLPLKPTPMIPAPVVPVRITPQDLAPHDMLATSCKSDSDCKGSESCVDGTCSLPAKKVWDEPPPHSALASWGDSLRIVR